MPIASEQHQTLGKSLTENRMTSVQAAFLELSSPRTLMIELLEWIAARPRTYGETMAVWRTSCPRMPIWEDAIDGGLIQVVHTLGIGLTESAVELTPLGRAMLQSECQGDRCCPH